MPGSNGTIAKNEAADQRTQLVALEKKVRLLKDVTYVLERYIEIMEAPHVESSVERVRQHNDRHPYVTFSPSSFIEILQAIEQRLGDAFTPKVACNGCGSQVRRRTTFIDIGCGLGDKLAYASSLGFEAHGLEIDELLVRDMTRNLRPVVVQSNRIVRPLAADSWTNRPMTLYPCDALAFDYSELDVIYFYRPISDEALGTKLESRIWADAKPGAFVIAGLAWTKPSAAFELVDLDCLIPSSFKVYRKKETRRRSRR